MNQRIVKFAGRRLIEAAVHVERIGAADNRGRLVILPNGPAVGSNLLWGREMAVEMRKCGWRVTVVPPQLDLLQRQRIIAMERPDAILMIKGRHPLNRPALYRGIPSVFILDDADYVLDKQLDQVVECCRDSAAVIAGNRTVASWASQHNARVEIIWVSHPVPRKWPITPNSQRRPIVAWAHAAPWNYPIEAGFVHDVMLRVAKRRPVEYWLYGERFAGEWDEQLRPIREAGATVRTIGFRKSYRAYLASLDRVAVGLHPVCLENPYSEGKSFGKTLAYMAADVAVVTHDVGDHSEFFRHRATGMLARDGDDFAESVVQLLDEPMLRQRLVDDCRADFVERLGTPVAARKIDELLAEVLGREDG